MDFDSIISVILILLFFIAPSILKQFAQKKNKEGKVPQRVTKLSLFQRLGEQIRDYALNLEGQTRKNGQGNDQGWEAFAEDQDPLLGEGEVFHPEVDSDERDFEPPARPIVPAEPKRTDLKPEKTKEPRPMPCARTAFAQVQGEPSSRQLQRAIIWSEILSKPIALRNNSM